MGKKYDFKFIDLFAGIGGFHQAMRYLGGECVLASEIDQACIDTYKLNYGEVKMMGDIRNIDSKKEIPFFDVLCAGFPCQSFSKAGLRLGFNDALRGDLFSYIVKILKNHPETKFVILENVRNLADNKEYWEFIQTELMKLNFFITEDPIILSPSDFGIPQIRDRVYILGIRKDLRDEEKLPNGYIHTSDLNLDSKKKKCKVGDSRLILEKNVSKDYYLNEEQNLMLEAWNEFKTNIFLTSIGSPIWLDSFGYEIEDDAYFYIICEFESMPKWKQKFVEKNRQFYKNNKVSVDNWIRKYDMMNRIKVYRKFEWNCSNVCNSIREGIIQFRQSGIRVKRPINFPSLVALVNTPIIWDESVEKYRFLTPREAANLQSFSKNYKFIGSDNQIYKQLGNSVNVRVLKVLGENLFKLAKEGWDRENYE